MQYICGSNIERFENKQNNGSDYCVKIGIFTNCNDAIDFQLELLYRGIKTDIIRRSKLYSVQTKGLPHLDEAAAYEYFLRYEGFDTILLL